MNLKQAIGAAILLVPVVTSAVMAKPAAAAEGYIKSGDHTVLVADRDGHREGRYERREERYEHREGRYERRRIFIRGHWDFDRYGHRFWVPDCYEYRYF